MNKEFIFQNYKVYYEKQEIKNSKCKKVIHHYILKDIGEFILFEYESILEITLHYIRVFKNQIGKNHSYLLYNLFGIILNDFKDYDLFILFINPVAEYSFKKAISLNLISQSQVNFDFIHRAYTPENYQLHMMLEKKLNLITV